MTLQITGKNLDVGDAMRTYVEDRIAQIFDKYLGREPSVHVRIEKEHGQFRTACSVHLWQGTTLEAHGDAADPHQSADLACERLDKRLRRYKRRLNDHHSNRGRHDESTAIARQAVFAAEAEEAPEPSREELSPVTVAETTLPLHALTVGEAVMRMELGELPVLMFRHSGSQRLNVVYRRTDGNIGWLDPAEADA